MAMTLIKKTQSIKFSNVATGGLRFKMRRVRRSMAKKKFEHLVAEDLIKETMPSTKAVAEEAPEAAVEEVAEAVSDEAPEVAVEETAEQAPEGAVDDALEAASRTSLRSRRTSRTSP